MTYKASAEEKLLIRQRRVTMIEKKAEVEQRKQVSEGKPRTNQATMPHADAISCQHK